MSEIKPALTSKEWAEFFSGSHFDWLSMAGHREPDGTVVPPDGGTWLGGYKQFQTRHGEAARSLHEQPFGFTLKDVVMHREAAEACVTGGQTTGPGSLQVWHESMADRIEALLPPEDV